MEHNESNPNIASATLCRAGCGFYGNAAFEGMCSKCYKDSVKRRQQNPTPTSLGSGRVSPAITTGLGATVEEVVANHNLEMSRMGDSASALSIVSNSTTPSVDTATTTVPTPSATSKTDDKEDSSAGAEASAGDKDKDGAGEKKKKNRCHTCRKKVGLTGFECRCGGMYCSLHRYSDKHECTFNYKEMAQEQIRKNNPVVVGDKIQKI